MANIYASISVETLQKAREMALTALHELTNGEADKAIELAMQYKELDDVLKENEERAY